MNDTMPKPFVFVVMPFAKEFDQVYENAIKPACIKAGAYCERIDEQIFEESILARIYNQISKADIIVGDLSQRNSNVFYEIGYAHALDKRVVLLTQNADDIPFDLKPYPHIIYSENLSSLTERLEKRIRWCLDYPKESQQTGKNWLPQLIGKWKSTWDEEKEGLLCERSEILYIERQEGNRLYGRIISEEPEQAGFVCNLEGIYNEGFLQIFWYPAFESRSRDLLDYGCYFLQHKADGTYEGRALGFYWNIERIEIYLHRLSRIED